MQVPLFKTTAGEPELEAVRKVFKSGWLGKGPRVAELEGRYSDLTAGHAVAVNSCTAALELAYRAFGVCGGDVIVPTWTFCSTAHAAVFAGAHPVFADIDSQTLCATVDTIAPLITDRTAAIAWVAMAGNTKHLFDVACLAKEHGIPLVIDAAHCPA